MFNQEWLVQNRLVGKQGWSSSRSIAADKYERQTSRRNDLCNGTDVAACDIDVENGQIEYRRAGQRLGRLNTTGLVNGEIPLRDQRSRKKKEGRDPLFRSVPTIAPMVSVAATYVGAAV